MSRLSAKQVEAVAQLREIIDGADEDVAISVLNSVDWDVQVRFTRPLQPLTGKLLNSLHLDLTFSARQTSYSEMRAMLLARRRRLGVEVQL